jgi:predicted GIY-YIG superfamily endonuclease
MDPQSSLAVALKSQARSNAIAKKELAASKTEERDCKFFVYVLLLQEGRIYVGATDNVYQRLYDHYNMTRSTAAFVRMYGPPTRVLEIVADASPGDEDAITAKYIAMFGNDSVRGGKWHSIFSPPPCDTRDVRVSDRAFRSLSRAEIDDVTREIAALSAIEVRPNPPPTASLEFMP